MFNPRILKTFPPWVVRLMARKKSDKGHRVVAMSSVDISRASGISVKRVHWISAQASWDEVTVRETMLFSRACGFTYSNIWKQRWFLKRTFDSHKSSLRYVEALRAKERQRISMNVARHWENWIAQLKEEQ